MRFVISTNVWGEKYVNKFLRVGFEALLKEIREYNLNNRHEIKFSINTDQQSNQVITKELNKRLDTTRNIEIEISNIEILEHEKLYRRFLGYDIGKYSIHTVASNKDIISAKDKDIIIFNYADFIWGSGSLRNLVSLFEDENNYDLVLNHPLTVDESELTNLLALIHSDSGISNFELTKKSINSAKWWYDAFEWLNHTGNSYQSLIYWPIDERKQSYVFRGFHLNLLAVRKRLRNGKEIPQINVGTLDGSYYPWQLRPLEPVTYFVSDLNFINVVATATKSEDLGSMNRFGHYIGNLQRSARNKFGKNEQNSLKEVLIISAEEVNRSTVEFMKEITYQHLKPILDMDLPIVNTLDLNSLILNKSLLRKTGKDRILNLRIKFIIILILVRIPYFVFKIFTDFFIYVIVRLIRIIFRISEVLKLEFIFLKKKYLQNTYTLSFNSKSVFIDQSRETDNNNFIVKFTILRSVYRSTNIFFEEKKVMVDKIMLKIDKFLEARIEKRLQMIDGFKD